MISFQSVIKAYNSGDKIITAIGGVSFAIEPGEFVSLVGKSGSGKTTLIKLLVGEEKPTEGSVFFQDLEVSTARSEVLQKIRRKIGVVYQDYKLLLNKTVKENLSYIMEVIGAPQENIDADIPQVLSIVGLDQRMNNFPHELSGGEKQRLAIARALIHRPQVIVADEPTGNLDLYNTYEIISLLQKINNLGTTVMLSTHNKEIVDALKKRVITLESGKIISDEKVGKFIL
ncbi:MAG: ATP-binding cassette domain-containing protein [Candidatus Gribaldobacteria bacterium]|nr:ATP-binding cassette domain-containing protein [Candidatus Gribaldobacteria bacterium]